MEENETLSEIFKREIEAISTDTILDPAYRKRKIILWLIRTVITLVLYILFWKYDWVKWTLILTIPLNLFSLFTIIGSPYFLKRKIERTKQKISETDKRINEPNDDEQ